MITSAHNSLIGFMIRAEQIAKLTADIEDLKSKVQLLLKLQGRPADLLKESATDSIPRFKPYDLCTLFTWTSNAHVQREFFPLQSSFPIQQQSSNT